MLYFPYNEDTGDVHRNDGEVLQLFDQIHLHHYPDFSKPRTSYLPLLEQRARENPEDWYGLIYLAHEYFYRKMYQNSIDLLHKILEKYAEHYNTLEQASCYLFAGDSYVALEQYDEAAAHFKEAIKIEPTYREPYINLAKVYRELKQFDNAKETLLTAIQSTHRHFTWLERDISWTYELADEMCLATWNLGDLRAAANWAAKAWSYEPENERLHNNLKICMDKLSELDLI
jgi:tetratricopeptide (TPR) repeat protein